MILTALGVDMAGNKEVLALRACAEEGKDGWISVLEDIRRRGATQMDLLVTDGHDGLLAAITDLFPATPRQRCLLHKQRNVLNAVPRRVRHEVEAELAGIWTQPTKEGALTQLSAFKAKYGKLYPEAVRSLAEEEDKTLTFYDFPQTMHRSIRTTNAIESLFSNVRQRTDQIDVFTTEMSCLTIVWATIEGIRLRKVPPGGDKGRGSAQDTVSNEPAWRTGVAGGGFLRLYPLASANVTDAPVGDNAPFFLAMNRFASCG